MFAPRPPVSLEGHCSAIHNNTLYTYSQEGFLSIPLEYNATWTELTPGVPVSDAVCVTGGIDGDESQQALYIVGGTSSKSENPGLQRYSFKDKKWRTIPLTADNLSNRTYHGAVYLKSISSILVYGGNQKDGSTVSSDTFIARTYEPYDLDSQSGEKASPAASPVLLSWSDDTAALFGGETSPVGVHFWDSVSGWHGSGFEMTQQLPEKAKFALFNSTDGSKIFQTFDMSVSPNDVTSMAMFPDSANPQVSRMVKRVYPSYDDSTASTTTRQGYSLAQDDDGQVVISSGNGTESIVIFDQAQNDWVNSTQLFFGDKSEEEILDILGAAATTTTTTSTTPTPTATETGSSTLSDSSSDDSGNDNIGTIIGATLGGLVGVAIILILILMLLKRKKQKMARAGGMDKDRLSFQDQGVEPLTRSAYPMAESPAPRAASIDSFAIFTGNTGDEKSPRSAGALPQYMQKTQPARPSPLNNIQSSDSDYTGADKEIEVEDSSARPGDRTTDEGWGKYFQNNSTPTLVGMSQYDSSRGSKATIWPGGANTLPPLNTTFLDQPQPLGRVNSGSPTTEFATSVRDGRQIAIPQSQSAQISSADSISLHSDDDDEADRGYNPRTQSWLGRPPSSAYSRSFYNPTHSTRELPSTTAASPVDYRRHDSARTNTRGSSILIPDGQPLPRNNVNSDMSWLNLHADR
ncbi:hypothetical protein BJX68DRAFT_165630 [Aspergillus pseudodeflectus]|uniref:Pre-mRNA splicing factor CLF1 n=1 Tax=Aspergillus pseudodeflectus TaxID=176178 RepID=A0ABR4L1M5_9EURO